jgi:hypothetical protein
MSRKQYTAGMVATEPPNDSLWQPPPNEPEKKREPLTKEQVLAVITRGAVRWTGRKRSVSSDAALKLFQELRDLGYSKQELYPLIAARDMYQLLADQSQLHADLVKRIK